MTCSIMKKSAIYIFFLISIGVCDCIFPFCGRKKSCYNREAGNFLIEKNDPEALFPAFDSLKCVLCVSISYTKSIFNNFVKKTNIMFNPAKQYIYKPPPSLFETMAVWTGAIDENKSDDEIWVSQKLFMLASTVIFSMLVLHFGPYWLAKLSGTSKMRKFSICANSEEFAKGRISSSVSLATYFESELDKNKRFG